MFSNVIPLPASKAAMALLAELRRHGRVEVSPKRSDAALYHLGNNALHAEIYRRAIERPGVVVLHDAVLHHFLLGQLDEPAYINEFVYNYGEWNRGLAGELWRGRAAAGADSRYFEFPMLRRAMEKARAVVVHNPEAARIVKGSLGAPRVVEIPHLFAPREPPPSEAGAERYRQRLGLEPGAFLLGIFGFLRESRRLLAALEVFEELRRQDSRLALLVAGDFVSSDLERAATPLLASPGVIRRPYLEEREFWAAASAVDTCINLRDPAAGETSGIAIRLMGLGKPVLATASQAWARFPEGSFLPVARGAAERESLREHVRLLTSVAEAPAAIGERGAAHIQAHHRVEQAGELYWELLRESYS